MNGKSQHTKKWLYPVKQAMIIVQQSWKKLWPRIAGNGYAQMKQVNKGKNDSVKARQESGQYKTIRRNANSRGYTPK